MSTRRPNWTPHYDALRARLRALRYIFPGGGRGGTFCALFDEFLEHSEFGLALDVLCDFLLEPEVAPPTEDEFRQIAALHVLMELQGTTLLRLRDKLSNSRSTSYAP